MRIGRFLSSSLLALGCFVAVSLFAGTQAPEEYSVTSSLKIGDVYGGEIFDYGSSSRECALWADHTVELYGDEYAFISVTGTGTITPVVYYGNTPSNLLGKVEVWTDAKLFSTITGGIASSKWDDEDDMWECESNTFCGEWPKQVWPKKKAVSGRSWIVVPVKESSKYWSGVRAFRVGIKGTSQISEPIVVAPASEQLPTTWCTPANFFRGMKISGVDKFYLQDWVSNNYYTCEDDTYWTMQLYSFDNWATQEKTGANFQCTITVAEAGTLVMASDDGSDGVGKDALKVSGSYIKSDKEEELSDDDYVYDADDAGEFFGERFLKTSYASTVRRIYVSKGTTLTLKGQEDEDLDFSRLYFYPKSGKSVAIEAGFQQREENSIEGWDGKVMPGYVTGMGVYKAGEKVTLKAVAGSGEKFDHWEYSAEELELSDEQLESPTLTFKVPEEICGSMNEEKLVYFQAVWKPKYSITALPSIVGAGTVTGSGRYLEGKKVTLTATPAKGYSFVKWSDGETEATRTLVVEATDEETVLYACFEPVWYTISFYANGGTGTMESLRSLYGGSVRLTANAFTHAYPANWQFKGWATSKTGAVVYADKATLKNIKKRVKLYAVWELTKDAIYFTDQVPSTYTVEPGQEICLQLSPTAASGELTSITVSGLPTGLTYADGIVSGVPKAALGSWKITVSGKSKLTGKTLKRTFTIKSTNPSVVGTFYGTVVRSSTGECADVDESATVHRLGTIQMTVSSSGKVSGKLKEAGAYEESSFSGRLSLNENGDFVATLTLSDVCLYLRMEPEEARAVIASTTYSGKASDDGREVSFQWKAELLQDPWSRSDKAKLELPELASEPSFKIRYNDYEWFGGKKNDYLKVYLKEDGSALLKYYRKYSSGYKVIASGSSRLTAADGVYFEFEGDRGEVDELCLTVGLEANSKLKAGLYGRVYFASADDEGALVDDGYEGDMELLMDLLEIDVLSVQGLD